MVVNFQVEINENDFDNITENMDKPFILSEIIKGKEFLINRWSKKPNFTPFYSELNGNPIGYEKGIPVGEISLYVINEKIIEFMPSKKAPN